MSEPFDADALGALYQKARTLEDAGDLEGAASVFAACLALDPDDHCGVTMRLAAHGLAAPLRAPAAYVATLFDQTAPVFDDVLVDKLGYDVPALARRLVEAHAKGPFRILDLGCGTGLAGEAFNEVATGCIGVDLSTVMLEMADDREVYDDLYVADAVTFLEEWDEAPFDLIVATDVWPYLGPLEPFLAGARRCLTDKGWLVASTERAASGWAATPTHRFAHASDYVTGALNEARFHVAALQPITVRHEEGVPVVGDLVLAHRL
ncbi:MAG: methyltransferase domain-containing protein [Devosia sp.]